MEELSTVSYRIFCTGEEQLIMGNTFCKSTLPLGEGGGRVYSPRIIFKFVKGPLRFLVVDFQWTSRK